MQRFLAKQKAVWMLLLSILIFPLNGCVYLVVGGVGALGGYVASPDTVEGTIVGLDYDEAWEKSVEVLSRMGVLEQRNETMGILEARLQGKDVKVTLFRVGTRSIKLAVKARQMFLPKVKVAQDVYVKIVSELNGAFEYDNFGK